MQILFIRHGETDWNKEFIIQGRTDNSLNEVGRGQAIEAAQKIKTITPNILISSPLKRAKETMEIISSQNKWEKKIIEDKLFLERNFGEIEGKYFEKRLVENCELIPGYELNKDIEKRVNLGIKNLMEMYNPDDVIVVACHSHTIKAILASNFKEQYDYSYSLPNCVIVKTKVENGVLKLVEII